MFKFFVVHFSFPFVALGCNLACSVFYAESELKLGDKCSCQDLYCSVTNSDGENNERIE